MHSRSIGRKNARIKLLCKDQPLDAPMVRRPDTTLAKSKLGWEPTIKLDEALIRALLTSEISLLSWAVSNRFSYSIA